MTEDEKAAAKAATKYEDALYKHGLDNIEDGHGQSKKRYMMDAFYAGFYTGRNYGASKIRCVYCGMIFPKVIPPYGTQILTDHIKVCKKHPMYGVEGKIEKLRKALIGLVGTETIEELEQIELGIRMSSAPDSDKTLMLNAVRALRE